MICEINSIACQHEIQPVSFVISLEKLLQIIRKMSKFTRPESLPFPQTFYTFKAKDLNNESIVEYRVQDLPADYFEEALDLIVEHFLPAETFCIALNILKYSDSVEAIREFYREVFSKQLSIACFKNDGTEAFVGVNALVVKSRDVQPNYQVNENESFRELLKICLNFSAK